MIRWKAGRFYSTNRFHCGIDRRRSFGPYAAQFGAVCVEDRAPQPGSRRTNKNPGVRGTPAGALSHHVDAPLTERYFFGQLVALQLQVVEHIISMRLKNHRYCQ